MPVFRLFNFHSRFCSVIAPCGSRSPALVTVTEETVDMNLERKVARKLRLVSSPVFEVMAWVLALFVPHKKGFGKFRHRGEGGPQAGAQFSTTDAKEALQFSNAIDSAQDLPREEPAIAPNVNLQDGLASSSFISGGVWTIESG